MGPARHGRSRALALAEYFRWEPCRRYYEVYHVNHDPHDDRPENLLYLTVSAHRHLHHPHPPRIYVCPTCWQIAWRSSRGRQTDFCRWDCYREACCLPGRGGRGYVSRPVREAWVEESRRAYVAGEKHPGLPNEG